ncbi:MAG: response regulator [Victivallaceae bacterium]|nr:response regulator [Victivallaceae bacterium]
MANERILIVEDEPEIRELVKITLTGAGFHTFFEAADGETALRLAAERQIDLILLDLMLPGIDGLSVCRRLKENASTRGIPVIMLTAKSEEADIVIGLELGAADYITKPFSCKVLAARVRAQLRLAADAASETEFRRDGLVLNRELHRVALDGGELELTSGEFELLALFVSRPGRVYTRGQIIAHLRGDDYPVTERAIDVQIVNLRRKLGEWGVNIETVRGVGYRMKSGGIN